MNRKTARLIFFVLLFLLVLIYYFRKRGEERIIPGVEAVSGEKNLEQTGVKKTGASQSSPYSPQTGNIPSPEKTPDPFADMEPSTPVLALLYGKVTDKQGSPIPQTQVMIRSNYSFWIFPEVLASALTDENGEYRFNTLPPETVQVLAIKEGYFLEHASVTFRPRYLALEKNFILSKGGLPLGGMAQDKEGNLVSGAMVRLSIPGSQLVFVHKTNDKGTFRFEGLWDAPANLSVLASGFVAWFGSDFTIGIQDMKIVLSREGGTKIKGVVYSNDSKTPVPGAIILAQDYYSMRFKEVPSFAAIAGENGSYELGPLIPGRYHLSASKDHRFGEMGFARNIELVKGGADEVWVDLFLPEMYDIRGCVIDADNNNPVPGAIIHVQGINYNNLIMFQGSSFVLTDNQGLFRIPNCSIQFPRGSSMTIWADVAGYVDNYARIDKLSLQTPPVTIKLKKGIHFLGTIFSDSGEPVNNVYWELLLNDDRFNRYTDSSGKIDEMIPSEWAGEKPCLFAYSPEHGFSLEYIDFTVSGKEVKHDVILSPGIPVSVIVMDGKGKGIKDCEIKAQSRGKSGFNFEREEYTDSEGIVNFKNLPKLLFSFMATHQIFKPYKSKDLDLSGLDGPQEIVFSLDEPEEIEHIIHGVVTDQDGKLLSDVKVELGYPDSEYLTDLQGKYRIEIVKSENWVHAINFSKKGYGKVREHEHIDREKDVREIEINAVLEEQEDFVLFGNIKGQKGDIPTDAEIQVFIREKDRESKWCHEYKWMSLKQGGAFELELDQDIYREGNSYSIGAKHSIYGVGHSREIMAQKSRSLGPFDIELSWGKLKGYVRDGKTGQSIGEVLISTHELDRTNTDNNYFWSNDVHSYSRSDENGYFELSPVSIGGNDIYFYHPDYWIQKKNAPEISAEHPEIEWNPVLDPKAQIKGRIYKNDGSPIVNANIHLLSREFSTDVKTDEKGCYSIKGMPSGKFFMDNTMEPELQEKEYRSLMIREIEISEAQILSLDIKIPDCVPVTVDIGKIWGILLEPLFPSEYKTIHVSKGMEFTESGDSALLTVPLPVGRFLIKMGYDKQPKEIEITPTGENRIIIEDTK
jgi:protocatechuate 3,4-dioxygenase beta subunit